MFDWFRDLSRMERKGFYGAFLGHAVDVFDFMIYSFLISTLLEDAGYAFRPPPRPSTLPANLHH